MTEQLSPDALQFSETVRRYGGKEAYARDLAAGRTALPYERWVQNRTPVFLAESAYGDWQSVSNRLYLDSEPITTVTGEEIPQDGSKNITIRISTWYQNEYGGKVTVEGIGDVLLDYEAVKNDRYHGIGKAKYMSFAAVPEILQQGRIISTEDLKGVRVQGNFLYFAAPIRINNEELANILDKKFRENYRRVLEGEAINNLAAIVGVKAIETSNPLRTCS